MSEKTSAPEPIMACSLCMKEMSPDLLHTHEGPDYVHHFCGLECYKKWLEQQAQEKKQD